MEKEQHHQWGSVELVSETFDSWIQLVIVKMLSLISDPLLAA